MNVVMTGAGEVIDVQATAERKPFSQDLLAELLALAGRGVETMAKAQRDALDRS